MNSARELGPGTRTVGLAVVGTNRRAGTQNLTPQNQRDIVFRQRSKHANDPQRKFFRPRSEIIFHNS